MRNSWYIIKDWPSEIKWFFQRLFRGYDDPDLWNFNSFTVRKLRKPFKVFVRLKKEHGHGCPAEYFDSDKKGNECERWIKLLEEMEFAFDSYWTDDWLDRTTKESIKNNLRVQHGFELFGKHIMGLWD